MHIPENHQGVHISQVPPDVMGKVKSRLSPREQGALRLTNSALKALDPDAIRQFDPLRAASLDDRGTLTFLHRAVRDEPVAGDVTQHVTDLRDPIKSELAAAKLGAIDTKASDVLPHVEPERERMLELLHKFRGQVDDRGRELPISRILQGRADRWQTAEYYKHTADPAERVAIIHLPEHDDGALSDLMRYTRNETMRRAILAHPNAGDLTVSKLVHDVQNSILGEPTEAEIAQIQAENAAARKENAALLSHPAAGDNTLRELADVARTDTPDARDATYRALLRHEKTGSFTLYRLAREMKHPADRQAIIDHPESGDEILAHLLRHPGAEETRAAERMAIIKDPRIGQFTQAALLHSKDAPLSEAEQIELAKSPTLWSTELHKIANMTTSDAVRRVLREHPRADNRLLQKLDAQAAQ